MFFNFRMAFSLRASSLQHIMIESERRYQQLGAPGLEQLREIKSSSRVISPRQIVTQVIYSHTHLFTSI